MAKGQRVTGTVEGTGAAIDVVCGFTPTHVRVVNWDGVASMEWFTGMGAAGGYKVVAAGTNSKVTTNGISEYAGVSGVTSNGFTIWADADVNASAETLFWEASDES